MRRRVVWKFPLTNPLSAIKVGVAASVVLVGNDPAGSPDFGPTVWIDHIIDDGSPSQTLVLKVVGTGHDVDDDGPFLWKHVGSTVNGPFAWHVYIHAGRSQ